MVMLFNFDRLSFQILSISRMRHANGSFRVASRPFSAIAFRIQGRGTFQMETVNFTAEKGDVSFFPAGMGYEAEYQDSEIFLIHLTDCNYHVPENIKIHHPEYISLLFKQLVERWNEGCSMNAAKAGVYHLLAKISEDQFSQIDDTFSRCSLYIQEHYMEPELRIPDICHYGHISEAGLYRCFIGLYGISPKQYILKLRLNAAIELLLQGTKSVQEIAASTGFQDAKYFSRIFKKQFGVPPSQYREVG